MIGKFYFIRQAATLLKFAKSTNDPKLAAVLIEKAADLKAKVDETHIPDRSPLAPDVEPVRERCPASQRAVQKTTSGHLTRAYSPHA